MTRIAIIGAGFSGTLLALHLLRRCPAGSKITLIEHRPQFGRGTAYAAGNPNHLLNVPAGRMSAFHDRPRDFLEWLEARTDKTGAPPTEGSFVPRQLFGDYIRHLLNREIKSPSQGVSLALAKGEAQRIEQIGGEAVVHLDRRRAVHADLVVLAVGNFPPESPPIKDSSFYDSAYYRTDPWASNTFTELDPDSDVMLIGTGLTMVDAAISLMDRGHKGRIHALSRRGLRPQRHHPAPTVPVTVESVPTSLVALTAFLRRQTEKAEAGGSDWRVIVDALRPFTGDVWAEMSMTDKARFLRHIRPWWEIHRHRMAGPVADRVEAATTAGQLKLYGGRIESFDIEKDQVKVRYRVRGTDRFEQLTVSRVVNCSGPGCDYARISHPLIRSLLEAGMVRPDPLSLGLDVTRNCALKDRQGAISRNLFAVGPVTKAAFWEMTAVPDIRRQCEYLANHLSGLAKPTPAKTVAEPVGAELRV